MRKRIGRLGAALTLAACGAWGSVAVDPSTVIAGGVPGPEAIDTIMVGHIGPGGGGVDSILVRFLDGTKPADFTACKGCAPDNIGAYVYSGWLYGPSGQLSLGYLRDSVFLIRNPKGEPFTIPILANGVSPFILQFPVNCPYCDREPSYPTATRYRFTFIGRDGSRADLELAVGPAAGMPARVPRMEGRTVRPVARDAAGRLPARATGPLFGR